MTPRERFARTLNFEKCDDRLPMIEWAAWWDLTIERWQNEGLPKDLSWDASLSYFDLDPLVNVGAGGGPAGEYPNSVSSVVTDDADYDAIRPYMYADSTIAEAMAHARSLKERHDRGDISIRVWLDGYFWFPRGMMGIERHMFAFYDQPELMHRINNDLADFNNKAIKAICSVLKPDMVGFAEDMSYNNGPMLSRECFNEFLLPYYKRTVPVIKNLGVKVLVDTDGDLTEMIPWLLDAGIEGVYPLERQAGVDLVKIRKLYPKLIIMGGYDKMVMSKGEGPMRAEFERILPVMRSGGFIPSCDHQTPPEVSLDNFKIYMKLFREYCEKAVEL
ncbi:MAG: uroporphyrinogen decarboxylase family protein [bacterium]